ncbi:hypothetical protein M0R04_08985 [Candidatus Dojkabacteria bacterium]|jgi:hypothetical protein|nr:hypothetical protein [Candidatus Dojkabacteria bacterium]
MVINKLLLNEIDKDIESSEKAIKNEINSIKKYESEILYTREKIRNMQKDVLRKKRARVIYIGEESPRATENKTVQKTQEVIVEEKKELEATEEQPNEIQETN